MLCPIILESGLGILWMFRDIQAGVLKWVFPGDLYWPVRNCVEQES